MNQSLPCLETVHCCYILRIIIRCFLKEIEFATMYCKKIHLTVKECTTERTAITEDMVKTTKSLDCLIFYRLRHVTYSVSLVQNRPVKNDEENSNNCLKNI